MSTPRTGSLTLGLIGCCALAVLGAAPCAAVATQLEAYGRLPHYEHVVLSPDGTRVAFVRTDADARIVVVMDLASGNTLGQVRAGDQKVRSIRWADDFRLLIFTSVTATPTTFLWSETEWRQLQVFDLKTGKTYMVPKPADASDISLMTMLSGSVTSRRIADHTVLFLGGLRVKGNDTWHGLGRAVVPVLLRVDLESDTLRVLRDEPRGSTDFWTIDASGEIAAQEFYDQRSHHWNILVNRGGHMQEVAAGDDAIDYPRLIGAGPGEDTLLLQRVESGDAVWRVLSLKDGSIGEPLAEKKTLDGPIEDPRTFRMIGGVHIGDAEEYVFFDPAVQQSWQATLRAFPNERVLLESAALGFRKMVVRVEGERDGLCFELIDLDTHHAEPLGDVYPDIDKPFEVRRIDYPAGDGLQIPAYLTLPRGKAAQKLPLIVLPHGGPAVRDTADFDWWSQALASQGYAVLRANFRGSAISRAFEERGFGEWGRKMRTDLSDGVRYLARAGIVDPARVCIVGASYGGYAALAGVSLEADVYRCAVSVAGIADVGGWLHWMTEQHYRDNAGQRSLERLIGASGPGDPSLEGMSPARHIDAITAPVLLIHGQDDTVVPFAQSQKMYDALTRAHRQVELVPLAGEDHWLSRSATRLQMLESSVAFLRKHNPPDP